MTHQRQYLPACDRLLVLRGGRVAAAGTWAELSGLSLSELHIPAGLMMIMSAAASACRHVDDGSHI